MDPTPFFSDFKDTKKIFSFIYFPNNLPAGTISSILKIKFFGEFCVKILFCNQSFSPLNTFMRKEKDPDPEPDPYHKTNGSGSATLVKTKH
jgi:hypothetical protein